jgi:SAM-dependent methyltransferase
VPRLADVPGTYGRFARYYDAIYEDLVNYAGDIRYLEAVFRKFTPARPRTLLDLGCGTGNHDLPLARRGHDVTGIDLSPAQLAVARRKAKRAGLPIRFVRADMRSFNLRKRFDAAICMFGGFGYLLKDKEVLGCLRSLRRHLVPEGVFFFEFWQSSAARPAPHQSWLHKVGRDYEIVRLSVDRYDPRTRLLPVEFRFFVLRGRRVLDRFAEVHTIRTYSISGIRRVLLRGGFDLLATYAATNATKGFGRIRRATFRVMAVARVRQSRHGIRRTSGTVRGPRCPPSPSISPSRTP